MKRQIESGLVQFRGDHTEPPFRKAHIRPVSSEISQDSSIEDESEDSDEEELATQVRGTYFYKQSQVSVKYLKSLMGTKVFNNPKDHIELMKLFRYMTDDDPEGIILDFFAGSGSTAEAVLQLNHEDETKRRFVLVQLPEPCNPKEKEGKAALKQGFETIADITKERIRRVITALNNEGEGELALESRKPQDLGFRVFKLDTSNFTPWDGNQPEDVEAVAKQLELHVEHILTGRTQEDILTELLLKSGFPLSTKVEQIELAGKKVFSVEEGAMLVCLEEELTNEVIKAMAEKKPSRVICLDAGFHGNDQLKTNAVQTMKARGVTSFRTV